MRGGGVGGLFDPADDLQFGESACSAVLVGLFGAFFQAVEQVVDVPVLGVIVLDVTG